jgi:hypothetical protein
MISHTVMNPNGGADIMRRVMEDRPLDPTKDDFCEPPIADPHDGWCGEGRLNAVPYPIRYVIFKKPNDLHYLTLALSPYISESQIGMFFRHLDIPSSLQGYRDRLCYAHLAIFVFQ